MGHYSERVRREALKGLQDLLTHNPGELRKQVGWLQDTGLQFQKGAKQVRFSISWMSEEPCKAGGPAA